MNNIPKIIRKKGLMIGHISKNIERVIFNTVTGAGGG